MQSSYRTLSSGLLSCQLPSTTCQRAHGHQGTEEAESTPHVCEVDEPFVFHARTEDLEWARAIDAFMSNADGRLKLVTMVKKCRCIVCRFEFKKTKCGRQAPKVAKYGCTGCQLATTLCAPEGGECWDSGGAGYLHDFDITRQY